MLKAQSTVILESKLFKFKVKVSDTETCGSSFYFFYVRLEDGNITLLDQNMEEDFIYTMPLKSVVDVIRWQKILKAMLSVVTNIKKLPIDNELYSK